MLYLVAYYNSGPDDDVKTVKRSFYGKYQCGGGIDLLVMETPENLSNSIWFVGYNDQKYVYVFTEYRTGDTSMINKILSDIEYKIHHNGQCHIILSDNEILEFGEYKFVDDSLSLNDQIIEADE